MPQIHPLALVEPGAQLADDVIVGPFAYVGGQVQLGPGSILHHHASIEGTTIAGAGNEFFPHSAVGGLPQDLKYRGGNCRLVIGDRNIFRENVTIHIGTEDGGGLTRLGSGNLLMIGAHVAHDCLVGDSCILANNTLLAGHVVVENNVVISGAAAVHHFVTLGEHSFIGGLSAVVHDVPPFLVANGQPAAICGFNRTGLKRRGFTEEQIKAVRNAYRLLFKDKTTFAAGAVELEKLYGQMPQIQQLLAFMERSNKGKHGRYRESLRGQSNWEEEDA